MSGLSRVTLSPFDAPYTKLEAQCKKGGISTSLKNNYWNRPVGAQEMITTKKPEDFTFVSVPFETEYVPLNVSLNTSRFIVFLKLILLFY